MLPRSITAIAVELGLLASALLASACGPAELDYSVVYSPGGGEFKLEELRETRRPGGERALLLRYRTDLELSDVSALEREIADVWDYLRPRVEDRGFRAAVVQAAHWEPPSWQRRGTAVQYLFEASRNGDGSWAARPDTSATSTAPATSDPATTSDTATSSALRPAL